MSPHRLHVIWFFHQPFFIPDDEILWRINSTYLPLLEALNDRGIQFTLGITAALLERCAVLQPDFVEVLRKGIEEHRLTLIGTTAYHPVLPWLSSRSSRAQILVDLEVKARLKLPIAKVFWPTELAWSTQVGSLAVEFGYESVVVDSSARDSANMLPRWKDTSQGLRPIIDVEPRLGASSKVSTHVGASDKPMPLSLWVRERGLSNALLTTMHSDEEDSKNQFSQFEKALELARSYARDGNAPLILADDPERYLPNGLSRLMRLLDAADKALVEFVSTQEFAEMHSDAYLSYIPASTMEGSDAMWSSTVDDSWFRRHLDHMTARVEARLDLLSPKNSVERAIRHKLLRVQDSGFYFWHYVGRARREFYSNLVDIENWLDGRSAEFHLDRE